VDLELTPEQHELRSLASELLAHRVPLAVPRSFLDGEGDVSDLWDDLGELGWYAVGLEDDDGFGVPGLAVLARELGRVVAPNLLVDVAVAARIVATAGSEEACSTWLEPLTDGTVRASLAVPEPGAQWAVGELETTASRRSGGYALSGTKTAVTHGAHVGVFGVVASLDGEPAFFLVDAGGSGVEVVADEGIDPTARATRVVLDDATVRPESAVAGPEAGDAIRRAFAIGAVATAAEAVGAASAALDLAVAYAQEREQFKRRIATFQAVQHLLADAHVLCETAWSTTLYAAAALDEDVADAAEATTIAKAYVARAARKVVQGALQVLGGIGFTWEHDLHLFLRRALACEQRFGDAAFHEQRLADALAQRAHGRLTTTGRS
jgi:alkylation response protein AidB-like acyl-CoA dehydrogenase